MDESAIPEIQRTNLGIISLYYYYNYNKAFKSLKRTLKIFISIFYILTFINLF
jgi:hypothetical protein